MTNGELFLKKTHINTEYFIGMVLEVLGVYEDKENNLGNDGTSTITCLDETGNVLGWIRVTEKTMIVQRKIL